MTESCSKKKKVRNHYCHSPLKNKASRFRYKKKYTGPTAGTLNNNCHNIS